MMDMMGNGHWMSGGMWLFTLLFWILIIAGVVMIVRWLSNGRSTQPSPTPEAPEETPQDILKRRYANGDIDRETFETMKRDINGDRS